MGKRIDGEGTLSKRKGKNGKLTGWKGAVTVGFKLDGTPDRRWVSGKTPDEVREKMEAIKSARNSGMISSSDDISIADYLNRWILYKKSDGTRLKTVTRYEQTVRRHLITTLGKFKLSKLRPLHVESALQTIRTGATIKESRRARTILSMSLNQAVRWEMIPRNVCQAVKPPSLGIDDESNVRFWTPEEVKLFLEAARGHRLYALFHLGFLTGMRPCELLGLRWRDVDLEQKIVRVEQDAVDVQGTMHLGSVKTKASRRSIPIPPDVVEVLKAHRSLQDVERAGAAEGYRNHDLVFASEIGTITGYSNLRRVLKTFIAQVVVTGWKDERLIDVDESRTLERYKKLLTEKPELKVKAALTDLGLHGLRHTHASIIIRRGYDAKIVADRLGHTSIAFTLKTYAHLYDEQRRAAAISTEDFLGGKSHLTVLVPDAAD